MSAYWRCKVYNQTGATVVGNLSFAQGNDDLYFYANSTVTGSIDGGGGENRLFLAGAAGSSDELKNTLSHFQTITKTGEGQWTISGSIKGTTASPVRSVRVEQGTLRLTGNNENFTGDLSINTNEDGSVGMHSDAVLEARAQSLPTNTTGNIANIKNYGTLRFVNDDTGTYVGQIIGNGTVEMTGSGLVVLAPDASAGNTYAGGTWIKNGTIAIQDQSALGTGGITMGDIATPPAVPTAGTLRLDTDGMILSKAITLDPGGGIIKTNDIDALYSGTMTGGGRFTKDGDGTLTLTSDGNFSALGTTVKQGTLQVGDGNDYGVVGGHIVTVEAGAALAFNRSDNLYDYDKSITGAGRVIQRGGGVLELTDTNNVYTGGTEIENGNILISDADAYNKTTGAANNAGHFLYAENGSSYDVDDPKRTIEVDPDVDQMTNHVHVAYGVNNVFQVNDDLEISGVTNNSPGRNTGGAVYVAGGAALDLNVGQAGESDIDLTFRDNKYGSTANDFYLDQYGVLNLNVSGTDGTSNGNAVFINSGIDGQGTVAVNGPGLVQISAESQASQTTVSNTVMRLVDNISYATAYNQDSQSSLQGSGTIDASGVTGGITIAGTISPDKATFEPGAYTVMAADRVGKLALVGGDTKLDSDFMYEYDVTAANTSKDPTLTDNDLVQFGMQTVTIANGTIDFRTAELPNGKLAALETGRYLLFDSPGATYVDAAGNPLSDLNGGVFTTLINGSSFIYPSPRRALRYEFDNNAGMPDNSQIWLDYLVNSLTMDWTGGATGNPGDGTWDSTFENWNSQQLVDGDLHEQVFMDGDKVHLYNNTATAIAINITEDATVSGMVAGRSSGNSTFIGDVTITGTGGITSDAASAFGIYLPSGNGTPTLTPTGKLELYGSYDNNTESIMTLTLANTGDNLFTDGIDIYGGRLVLAGTEADRLGKYAAGTGNAGLVTFKKPFDEEVNKHVVEVNLAQTMQNRFLVESTVNNAFIIANANTTISDITDTDGAIELQDNSTLTLQADDADIILTGNEIDVKIGHAQLNVTGTGNTFVKSGIQGEIGNPPDSNGSYLIKKDSGTLQFEVDSHVDHVSIDNGTIRIFNEKTLGNADTSSFYVAWDGQHGSDARAYVAGAGTVRANKIDVRGHLSPDNLNAADATAGSRYGTLTLEGSTSIVMKGFAMDFDLTTPTQLDGSGMPTNDQDLLVVNGAVVGGTGSDYFTGRIDFRTGDAVFGTGDYLVIQSSDGYNLAGDINGIGKTGALSATVNGRDAADLITSPRKSIEFILKDGATTNSDVWITNKMNSLTMDWTGGNADWVFDAARMQSYQDEGGKRETFFMNGDKVYLYNPTAGKTNVITVTLAEGINPIVSGLVAGQNSGGTNYDGDVTITGKGGITADEDSAFGEYVDNGGADALTPTGMLQKYGSGTLTFTNTGGNTFLAGTELHGGKIVIGHEKALGVVDSSTADLDGYVFFAGSGTRTIEVADTVESIKNHFRAVAASTNVFNNKGALTISGVVNNSTTAQLGGAFYVDGALTINADADLTLSGNSYDSGTPNDIYLYLNSRLYVNVADGKGMFVNSGIGRAGDGEIVQINGNGTVKDGFLQIAANSSASQTAVQSGRLRLVDNSTGGPTTYTHINSFALDTGASLEGRGTIIAGTQHTISGTVSPDSAVFTSGTDTVGNDDKIGRLTLQSYGNGTLTFESERHPDYPTPNDRTGFHFDYDVVAPDDPNDPTGSAANPNNDLIQIVRMNSVKLEGGVVNFRTGADGLGSGSYLIIDSNVAITDFGGSSFVLDPNVGTVLDGINNYDPSTDNGVLWGKINGEDIRTGSPRRELGFELRDSDKQIWLHVNRNTLTMVRTRGGVWNSTARDVAWISEQENEVTGEKEYVIERGDYARIYNPTAGTEFTISLGADQILSGLELGGDSDTAVYGLGDVVIDGDFGITAVTTDDWIEGDYLAGATPPKTPLVPVDGMLTKTGANTVTIANTGGNSFEQGTLIKQGTIVVGHEKALGTFDGTLATRDGTVVFDDNDDDKTVSIADGVTSVKNRFVVDGTNNVLETDGDVEISGIESGTLGGAIYLAGDAATDLTIDAKGGNFTFKNNLERNPYHGYNDIRVDGESTLNLTGTHHIFLDGGISGAAVGGEVPTVNITGIGDARTQVGQRNNFNGVTTISSGGLRVANGNTYGGSSNKTVTVQGASSTVTASLEGAGTVLTNEFIAGAYSVISPDNYDLSDTVTPRNEIGRLTIQGTDVNASTATLDGFTMDYDTVQPNFDIMGNGSNDPVQTRNDLLSFTDMNTVTITDGTINFRGLFMSGDYLIVDANTSIDTDGKGIDGIDDPNGVLKASYEGNAISNNTPRGTNQFELRDYETTNSQIWYTVQRNTLTMDRTVGGTFGDSNFVSRQVEPPTGGNGSPAYGFQHGDAAFLTNNGAAYSVRVDTIDLAKNATVVSHFEVGGTGDITLTGNGILATTDYAGIEGKFLEGGTGSPTVPVDGKFVKRGGGTFTFDNAANTFEEGIFLYGGTTAFNRANQLGDGGHGINFEADATLRADANGLTIDNTVNIADGATGTFENAANMLWSYTGQMTGSALSGFEKTGAGQVNLNTDSLGYAGAVTVSNGILGVNADYGNVTQFTVKDGATLTGTGILGATANGGVIESGGTLAPRGYTSGSRDVTFLTVNGALTFDADSNFDVTISQDPSILTPDGKMTPVSDYVKVDGVVTIDSDANLNVTFDYWNSELTINDFNEEQSSKFTVIDATDGNAGDEAAQFTLKPSATLPRGVKFAQGWQYYEAGEEWMGFDDGWLYQLWFEDDPDNNFENLCDHHNRIEIGSVLDYLVLAKDPAMKDLIDHLSDPSLSDKEVCDILDWLHGDIGPNSMMMALKKPWRHPFNRLDFGQFQACDPCGPTMSKNRQKRQLWGEFLARYDDVRSDRNAHPFTVNRFGVAVGVDQRLSNRLIVGANFQYSDPRLRQETGKTEMDDYEVGFYGLARLNDRWEMKLYAGYSHQRYDIDRRVHIPVAGDYAAIDERFRTKTDGDAFSASVELIRPMRVSQNMRLLPLIALDIEKAWMDGYRESGGLTALVYDNSSLERIMMRFGMQAEFNVRNNLDLQARIQYATQLNGTEYARTRVSFANATDSKTADIWGSRIGRDYLNLGIGADWKLNRKRSLSLFVNYDVDLYNRATIHAGEAGIVRQW